MPNRQVCLSTKAITLQSAIEELAQLAIDVGEELQGYKLMDLTDFSLEEMTRFSEYLRHARYGLRGARIMAVEGTERCRRRKKTRLLRRSRRGVNGSR